MMIAYRIISPIVNYLFVIKKRCSGEVLVIEWYAYFRLGCIGSAGNGNFGFGNNELNG
jgi:hypothetical protein